VLEIYLGGVGVGDELGLRVLALGGFQGAQVVARNFGVAPAYGSDGELGLEVGVGRDEAVDEMTYLRGGLDLILSDGDCGLGVELLVATAVIAP